MAAAALQAAVIKDIKGKQIRRKGSAPTDSYPPKPPAPITSLDPLDPSPKLLPWIPLILFDKSMFHLYNMDCCADVVELVDTLS